MTTTAAPIDRAHPIARFASRAREMAAAAASTPAWSMTADEQRAALVDLTALEAQVSALRLEVLLAGDRNGIGEVDASPSTAAWFASATRRPRASAHRDLDLARALDTGLAPTAAAFGAGQVNREQVEVIARAVADLAETARWFERDRAEHPSADGAAQEELPAGLLEQAEAYLLLAARSEDARALKLTARDLLARVAPEVAEEALGRKLAAEERAARARMRLVVRDNGDGTHSGSFTIPDLHAAMLAKALDALCSPRATRPGEPGHHLDAEGERLPRPEQRGQAFCAFLERYPADRLPSLGGCNATVVVSIGFDALTAWFGTAGLDTGGRISAGEARRLMCGAGILPAVLGGASEVLDLGREQRLFSKGQRRATNLAQPACVAEGCVRLAAQCEAHHLVPWSEGGRTDLAMAVNLCSWHHHRAHDPRYDLDRHPDGSVRFHRRT